MRKPATALEICGKPIRITRIGLVRVATLRDEICDSGVEDPELLVRDESLCASADILSFRQQLPDTELKYRYPFEWDNLALLELATYERWWTGEIHNDARRMVRKAEKMGVRVRVVAFDDAFVAGVRDIWNETRFRQGRSYSHYRKDFDTVKRENSTFLDRSEFIGAFFGEELIGFNKLFYTGFRADHVELVSKIAHRDKSPTNALLAKSVEVAIARRMRYLCYGKFTYGKKGRDSLTDFKERNGFRPVAIPRYFVPLTRAGDIALKIGVHNGVKELFPAAALRTYSGLRVKWGRVLARLMRRSLRSVTSYGSEPLTAK